MIDAAPNPPLERAADGYVVLTSKPGIYRSEPPSGASVVETYDYAFYGKPTAVFQIVRLAADARVRIVEEAPPHTVNVVPVRVMERYALLEDARRALGDLVTFGTLQATLIKR
ncbi:Ferredoxin [Bordetella sputigena]|uniref:ferredoxin n=1 Tax=Bordetella sputigena TaxID=1416810 RepID=UPI0039EE0E35